MLTCTVNSTLRPHRFSSLCSLETRRITTAPSNLPRIFERGGDLVGAALPLPEYPCYSPYLGYLYKVEDRVVRGNVMS